MIIESNDFFNPNDYEELRGQGLGFHALVILVNYARQINSQDFTVFDLVNPTKSLEKVKMAADFLSQKGMIWYDARTGKIHVKDKAMHVVEAEKGKADFDNMKIQSLTDTIANATLNLKERYLA